MSDCGEELPVHLREGGACSLLRDMILYGTVICTDNPRAVTCPACLALLERPADENPSIALGEE